MRILLISIFFIFSAAVKAQTVLPGSYMDHLQRPLFAGSSYLKDITPVKKWSVIKYMGISTSVGFFNGGNATVLAFPVGIQINRRLTNNWYAFAGVSAAPAYINFNHSFLGTNTNKFSPSTNFFRSGSMNMYSRAELGLLYTNDQKTFSISGSISVERSCYPLVPFNQMSTVRPNAFVAPTVK